MTKLGRFRHHGDKVVGQVGTHQTADAKRSPYLPPTAEEFEKVQKEIGTLEMVLRECPDSERTLKRLHELRAKLADMEAHAEFWRDSAKRSNRPPVATLADLNKRNKEFWEGRTQNDKG